jgi:hypothetical protein
MRLPKRLAPILILLITLTVAADRAAADATVASVANPSPVSIFNGRLVWSSFDPARNGYLLMTRTAGVTTTVPVATRNVPFDVDLGPIATVRR